MSHKLQYDASNGRMKSVNAGHSAVENFIKRKFSVLFLSFSLSLNMCGMFSWKLKFIIFWCKSLQFLIIYCCAIELLKKKLYATDSIKSFAILPWIVLTRGYIHLNEIVFVSNIPNTKKTFAVKHTCAKLWVGCWWSYIQ